jgi:hypothetical protein
LALGAALVSSAPASAQQTFGQLQFSMPKGVEERTAAFVSVTDSSKNAVCRYVVLEAAPGGTPDADWKSAFADMARVIGAAVPAMEPTERTTLPTGFVLSRGGGAGTRSGGSTFMTELYVYSGGGKRRVAFRYTTSIFRCAGRNTSFESSLAPVGAVTTAAPVPAAVPASAPAPVSAPAPAPASTPTSTSRSPSAGGSSEPVLSMAVGAASLNAVTGTWRYKQLPRSTSEYNPLTKRYEYKPQNAYLQQEFETVLQLGTDGVYVRRSDVHDATASESQRVFERGRHSVVGDELRFTPQERWQGVARLRQPVSLRSIAAGPAYGLKFFLGDLRGLSGLHVQNASGNFDRYQPHQP